MKMKAISQMIRYGKIKKGEVGLWELKFEKSIVSKY